MQTTEIKPFQVSGISIRTTNENDQAASDIGLLWERFMTEGILQKIPHWINDGILWIYSNYESDHTRP